MSDRTEPAPLVRFGDDAAAARNAGRPVVALETSVLAQGLPPAERAGAARRMVEGVKASGATAAFTAIVHGQPTVGLSQAELGRFVTSGATPRKASTRDLAAAVASGSDAATTVAAGLVITRLARLSVFCTGGIGGVHREPPFDESADLIELARTPVVVICAGAKSLLDLPATLERLETLGVPVVGYRTREFPGFLFASTGLQLSTAVADVGEIAQLFAAQRRLRLRAGLLVVQAPPANQALGRREVEEATNRALEDARREGLRGAAITPWVLGAVERATLGRSLAANLALLESNARLAGQVAVALATRL